MSRATTILRAAELHRKGLSTSEIARELDVSRSTIQRAKASHPDLFAEHEPGSLGHRRAILNAALSQGSLSEQLRAVELLEKFGANEKRRASGAQRIHVHLTGPTHCPACGEHLDPERGDVVKQGDG